MSKLAINGGDPIRKVDWHSWPSASETDKRSVLQVLDSDRWSVSGNYSGKKTSEELFARAFAEFHDVNYCVPTSSGTASIVTSLIALGIGKGDEVIIPALTWVACATAVLLVGAAPVLADIEADSLCIDPSSVKSKLSSRTKAILVVHLYSNIADIPRLKVICEKFGLFLIEDCAQSHGATLDGRKVGSFGDIGVFSMHQGKVLTSGEGGACITNNPELYDRAYRIKTNGRLLNIQNPMFGEQQLIDIGGVFSNNFCLNELASSLLHSRLMLLDDQNKKRFESKQWLEKKIEDYSFKIPRRELPIGTCYETTYHLPIRLPPSILEKTTTFEFARALSAEINFWVNQPYPCLSQNPLYTTIPNFTSSNAEGLVISKSIKEEYFLLHHSLLLESLNDLGDVIKAIDKLAHHYSGI